jgi:hypothetical protein
VEFEENKYAGREGFEQLISGRLSEVDCLDCMPVPYKLEPIMIRKSDTCCHQNNSKLLNGKATRKMSERAIL